MSSRKLPTEPTQNSVPSPTAGKDKTCPRCGKPLSTEYTCDCPERWENEGGALQSDHQSPKMGKA